MRRPSLLVYSHLRWESVFQRPHHLMTRLASAWDVWFIEEPVHAPAQMAEIHVREVAPGLRVCEPRTPIEIPGFNSAQAVALAPVLQAFLASHASARRINWLYTAMALPLARAVAADVTVYDCMDELSAFLHAPPELLDRERELLIRADLVFTGGPSLYRAKRNRHPRVHCFPSSVEVGHFAQAIHVPDAEDQRTLPRPRLGFYGVIDERFDTALIEAVAAARPHWQIVLVGPVVKIDPARLPRRPNLHYLGPRAYAELPRYLAGWDVCLLPFARNEATRFISPTKTLEYMAAERPIVSTSIRDVAEPYGDVVLLADTPADFVAACDRALTEAAGARAARVATMRTIVSQTSWDATAATMRALIEGAAPADRPAAAGRRPAEVLPA